MVAQAHGRSGKLDSRFSPVSARRSVAVEVVVKRNSFGLYSGAFVALGGLVALACLASTGYINRLQADLARAVEYDAVGMEAAVELQVQLRHLRVHSLV